MYKVDTDSSYLSVRDDIPVVSIAWDGQWVASLRVPPNVSSEWLPCGQITNHLWLQVADAASTQQCHPGGDLPGQNTDELRDPNFTIRLNSTSTDTND